MVAKRSKFDQSTCQTRKMNGIFKTTLQKRNSGVLYDVLKCAKLPLSTEHNAVYGLDDAVLVLLHMCKNGATANRAMTELGITLRDDRNVSIPTAQWLLGMISAIDPDKMGGPVQTHVREYDQKGILF